MAESNTTSLGVVHTFENQKNKQVNAQMYSGGLNEFTSRLHEFLDLYQLFDTFINELKATVPCDSIEYEDKSTNTILVNGIRGRHHCEYALKYDGFSLGQIRISRNYKITDRELDIIEAMLAGLSLPLRNALRYQQAIRLSQRDALTGLRNRNYYHDVVDLEIERAHRYRKSFSLLMLDLDNFEGINKVYGRKAGDVLLHEVAQRIESKARSSDVVYRNGGDEFLVFLPNTEINEATIVAQRIKDSVSSTACIHEDNNIFFTLSAGVVTVSQDDTAISLMSRVDEAIFHAKSLGRDRLYADTFTESVQQK